MDQATFRLGAVIGGAFRTVFARPVWFIALPVVMMAISAAVLPLMGLVASLVFSVVWVPFMLAVITGATLGHVRGDERLAQTVMSNIGRSTLGILLINLLYTGIFVATAWLLFVLMRPVPSEMLGSFWNAYVALAQSGGDPDGLLSAMGVFETLDPEAFVALLFYGLILFFIMLLLIIFASCVFAPAHAIVVSETRTLSALQRSIAMTRGYRGIMLGTSIVLSLIYFGMAIGVGILGSILVLPLTLGGTDPVFVGFITTSLTGLIIGWFYAAFTHLYIELRRAKGEDTDLYLETFQ